MEVSQTSDNSSSLETTSTEPVSSPAPVESTPSPTETAGKVPEMFASGQSAAQVPQAPPATPAYQPNFKFVAGKKEYEVPEMYRGLIKDPETEKMVKETLEKAHGIDFVKTERAKVQEEYKTYKSQTEPILQIATQLEYHRKKGDLTSYFQTLGLNKQDVWKWALQQAEIEGLPQDQKQVYDQHREAELRAYQLEQQLQQEREMRTHQALQQRHAEVESVLSAPDVASFVQSFDQRNGEGSFKEELIARGQMYWHTRQVDVAPGQLVKEIMTKYGVGQSVQAQPQVQPQVQAQQPSAPKQVPVIPNTGSGHVSPAARKPQTVEDFKKIYAEKYG